MGKLFFDFYVYKTKKGQYGITSLIKCSVLEFIANCTNKLLTEETINAVIQMTNDAAIYCQNIT